MKNKNFTPSLCRLLTVLLILSMISVSFGGCGIVIIGGNGSETSGVNAETTLPESTQAPETEGMGETGNEEVTETPPEDTEEPQETIIFDPAVFPSRLEDAKKALEALNDTIDISDFDIVLVTAGDTVDVIFAEEDHPLYAARSNRNSMLYEKYGVDVATIYENEADTDQIYGDLLAAVQTGSDAEYYVDLLMIPAARAGRFLSKGLLRDMRSLPFYDTKAGNADGNVGNARYFDMGAGTDVPEDIYSLYFNRTLVGKELTDLLYSEALDGSLSFETLLTVASSLEGLSADIAVTGGDNSLPGRISADLLGIEYIKKDRLGVPSIGMTDEELNVVDSFIECVSKFRFFTPEEGGKNSLDRFKEEGVPFYLGTLSDIFELYDDKVEWGLLPLPSEKGLGAIKENRPVICLPVTNTRLEQTSLWLTAFNVASENWIRDQLLAVAIENYIRDNNSCFTLYRILSQETSPDFTLVYSEYYEGLADATYLAAGNALGGTVKFSETIKSEIESLNKKLAKLP